MTPRQRVDEISRLVRDFSRTGRSILTELLNEARQIPLPSPSAVRIYHDALLFLCAYPNTRAEYLIATNELKRISEHVHAITQDDPGLFSNSGIGGSESTTEFSLALTREFLRSGFTTVVNQNTLNGEAVIKALMPVLTPVEYEMLSGGETDWTPYAPVDSSVYSSATLQWLVKIVQQQRLHPRKAEEVFESFNAEITWASTPGEPSITTSRAPIASIYTHRSLNAKPQRTTRAPQRIRLSAKQRANVIDQARGVLSHFQRETDPTTYTHMRAIEYYDCGKGLTVALFPMQADMKMAVQSYVGHMVFKNGVALAYGGTWLMFSEAGFGVNIFPMFRGGESARVVSTLIDLYRHVFNITSFTIDPYQLGSGNPDGIRSGAFWFYYRLGFRPEDKEHRDLARAEWTKITSTRGYRTPPNILRVLADSTMRKNDPGSPNRPINAAAIADIETVHIQQHFAGDRGAALRGALKVLSTKTRRSITRSNSVASIAVLLVACGYAENASSQELRSFIKTYEHKATNEARYVRESQSFDLLVECIRAATKHL